MANFLVTTLTYENKQFQSVLASMETAIEAVENTKTIRLYNITYRAAEDTFVGTIVHDT